jgi:hypothetical protein
VADAGRDDTHPHLAGLGRHDLDLFDGEGLTRSPGDGGFTLDALNLLRTASLAITTVSMPR